MRSFPGDECDVGRVEEVVARVLDAEVRVHRFAAADIAGHHEAALAGQRVKVPQGLKMVPKGDAKTIMNAVLFLQRDRVKRSGKLDMVRWETLIKLFHEAAAFHTHALMNVGGISFLEEKC